PTCGRYGRVRPCKRRETDPVPVHMKFINPDSIQELAGGNIKIRGTRRRRASLKTRVAGNYRKIGGRPIERYYLNGGRASIHLCFIEGERTRTHKYAACTKGEHVGRHVNAIRPNAEFRIIVKCISYRS